MSRIIAGSRGGRRLTMPPGSRTRPTTDRVREALFSAVAAWAGTAALPPDQALAGLAFADLYAGSGAVGLEAASRGAAPVLLVEGNRRTAQLAARNASELGLTVQLQSSRVEQVVGLPAPQAYDVAFLDPPYELSADAVGGVLAALVGHGWLVPDALVVLERSRRGPEPPWPAAVGDRWSKTYGETVLHYGTLGGGASAPDPTGTAAEQPDPTGLPTSAEPA